MRANMHTHSVFCDGRDEPRTMVIAAIEQGFDILGFSGHGYSPVDDCSMSQENTARYLETISALKADYQNQITIYTGIEQDSTCRTKDKAPYDFVIGSVHYLNTENGYFPVDYSAEVFDDILETQFDNAFLKLAENYYKLVSELAAFEEVDIIGHFDLLMKYNEDEHYIAFDDPRYLDLAFDCLDTLGTDKVYEVNTGAIARGYRKTPYPSVSILKRLKEMNAKLMLNSDCHDCRYLACGFDSSLALLKDVGFTELYILKDGAFCPVPIESFH